MNDEVPIVCSLDGGELAERLASIAKVGASSLISDRVEGGGRVLRFRKGPATRCRLEDIVAAEAECCSFLELALRERGDELVLSISAPGDGRAVADQLADAFGASRAAAARMARLRDRC